MRNLFIALVLLVTALTFYSALWFKSISIENDITMRVTDELNTTNAKNVSVDVDGRHVTLSGVVYDEATETAHLQTADETYGALGPIDGLTYLADSGYVTAVKDDAGITLRGTVPNDDVRTTLITNAQGATDGAVDDKLVVAGPAADWQDEAAFGVAQLVGLDTGTLTASTGAYALSGSTDGDPAVVTAALADRDGWQSYISSPMAVRGLSNDMTQLIGEIADRDATITGLEASMNDQTTQIGTLTSERDAIGAELDVLRANLTAGQTDSSNLQVELAASQTNLTDAEVMIAEKDQIIADNSTTIDGLNGQVTGLETELANRGDALGATDEQVVSLQGELDIANQSVAHWTGQVAERDTTIADFTAQVADRDQTITDLQQAASDSATDQVTDLNSQIAQRDGTIDALNTQVADTNGEVVRLEAELATSDGSLAQTAAQIALLTAATQTGDGKVESLQGEVNDLTAVVAERDVTIASMKTPVVAVEGMNAEQCAAQANFALERAQINFDTSTATIQNGSVPLLERLTGIALACVGDGGLAVEVGGHTDSQGSDENNQVLSEARAQAIVAFMAARGVPSDGLQAVGYGEAQPIGDNETDAGRAANRRISFEWQAR